MSTHSTPTLEGMATEKITDQERRRREVDLYDARVSAQMEGLGEVGPEVRAIQDAWARGEITADEMMSRVLAFHQED